MAQSYHDSTVCHTHDHDKWDGGKEYGIFMI